MDNYKRTRLTEFDYFPVFVDYNFAESRPRGGSAYFDFFACGKLSALIDEAGGKNITYIAKAEILPEQGFFLIDFAKMKEQPDELIKAVKNLKISEMYVEDSDKYPLKSILEDQDGINVSYVKFRR